MRICANIPDSEFCRILRACDEATTRLAGHKLEGGEHAAVDALSLASTFAVADFVYAAWMDETEPRGAVVALLKGIPLMERIAAGSEPVAIAEAHVGVFAGPEQAEMLSALFGDDAEAYGQELAAAQARRDRRNAKRARRH